MRRLAFAHQAAAVFQLFSQEQIMKRPTLLLALAAAAAHSMALVVSPASAALVPQKPLDISFAFLYREEWNDNTRSSARYQLLNLSR